MIPIFSDSAQVEKQAKERYCIAPNIMMENAASALESVISQFLGGSQLGGTCAPQSGPSRGSGEMCASGSCGPSSASSLSQLGGTSGRSQTSGLSQLGGTCAAWSGPSRVSGEMCASGTSAVLRSAVFIACGGGNNGADGLALARRLHGERPVFVCQLSPCKTDEAKIQLTMAQKIGVEFCTSDEFLQKLSSAQKSDFLVDCIFGTGFHGECEREIQLFIEKMNSCRATKIACDIPSALKFNADITVTMGCLKSVLFSDKAKNVCGKISVAKLGISQTDFEKCGKPSFYLIQKNDAKLPWRFEKSSHKGKYGHVCVFAGSKSGAAIMAATSSLNFGCGLVTLLESENSNLAQFKISPQLMVEKSVPEKTSCVLIGSGLGKGENAQKSIEQFLAWFQKSQNKNCVLDADILTSPKISKILAELGCEVQNQKANIILTPHLMEFSILCETCGIAKTSVQELSNIDFRRDIAEKFLQKFPFCTLVVKSANTLIATSENGQNEFFVVTDGGPNLAKAGSGDILAGLCASLLAQGYSAKDGAISATECHAKISHFAPTSAHPQGSEFDLTYEKALAALSHLGDVE